MKQFLPLLGLPLIVSTSVAASDKPMDLSVGMAIDQQLSVVVELDDTLRFTIGNDGAAFDYIVKRGDFESDVPFTWFVGAGAWSEWDYDEFGVRLPLGVNWAFSKGWDAYGQVHPELNLYTGPELQIGAALGVTYSF